MPITSRHRTRTIPTSGSRIRKLDNSVEVRTVSAIEEEMYDVVGNYTGINGLVHSRFQVQWPRISGEQASVLSGYIWNDYPCQNHCIDIDYNPPSVPSNNDSYGTAIAMSNPSKPSVDLPAFIGELGNLPRQIYRAGISILFPKGKRRPQKTLDDIAEGASVSDLGSEYLAWAFGWAPLVSDLNKLLQFNASVDKRVTELQNIYNKGGIRRNATVYKHSSEDQNPGGFYVMQSEGTFFVGKRTWSANSRKWFNISWVPDVPNIPDSSEMRAIAQKAVLGIELNPAAAWELMPWSWLIDWFSNVGDLLNATRNTVGVHPTSPCVMFETRQKVTVTPNTRDDLTCTTSNGEYVTHSRQAHDGTTTFAASWPTLSGKQLSILSALAVSRSGF